MLVWKLNRKSKITNENRVVIEILTNALVEMGVEPDYMHANLSEGTIHWVDYTITPDHYLRIDKDSIESYYCEEGEL